MSLCEIAQCDDVVGAFTAHEVVPDAVDVAPQEAVKVKDTRKHQIASPTEHNP